MLLEKRGGDLSFSSSAGETSPSNTKKGKREMEKVY